MDSILQSIKKLLGISSEYTNFDQDIMIHINSVFMILYQLGIGPNKPFSITGEEATWNDFIHNDNDDIETVLSGYSYNNLEAIKTYMYMKVRLMFDPPQSSAVTEVINKTISELEWRLYTMSGQY